jgi:hypothetical protein
MTDGVLVHVSDLVSWDEICRRFPERWIVLVELGWTDECGGELRTAFVAGHGTKREALAEARPLLAVFDKLGCFHTSSHVPALPPIAYASTSVAHEPDAIATASPEALAFA